MNKQQAKERVKELREKTEYYAKKYYDDDNPEISDFEYDMLMVELRNLEKEYPDLMSKESLTQKVGGHVKEGFEKVTHEVPLQSLQDVFSLEDVEDFDIRMHQKAKESGIDDIKSKKLRVLHDKSFEDDPTRILRALKFSLRFGFTLDESTARFQKEYLKNINYDMSYHRLKKELVETFNLNSQEAYDRFTSEGIYKLLGKSVLLPEYHPDFRNLNYSGRHIWLIYLSFFNLENLELTRAEKRIIEWAERLKTEKQTNNTPIESIIINEIYKEAVS